MGSQSEQRDGYATSGSYSVNLPDGRVQTVTYADNGDGITQDVSYSGEPAYRPTVVAHASPVAVAHAPVAVAHAAPLLSHAVHAAPVLSHAVHAAPVLSHTVAHPTIIG